MLPPNIIACLFDNSPTPIGSAHKCAHICTHMVPATEPWQELEGNQAVQVEKGTQAVCGSICL